MSGVVDDFSLIKLVESHPILYDKDQARGHRNATMKDKAWKDVSTKLQASERACITRWKSMRDRFGKEFRRVQENPDEPTNWDMFPHLLFLRNHYKHGNVPNDTLIEIKYEPKERKRKSRTRWGDGAIKEEEQSDEMNPEELMINQQLIDLVKMHPVLYDKQKIRDSKNLILKNCSWSQISETLGLSEDVCYKRWKRLRDRFSREYRYHAIAPEKPVTWVYFQDLMFLEQHYRKGVPLQVENLKRKPKDLCYTPTNIKISSSMNSDSVDSAWGNDYSYICDEKTEDECEGDEIEELVPEADNEETYIDVETQNLDDLLIVSPPQKKWNGSNDIITEEVPIASSGVVTVSPANIIEETNTEAKLMTVIGDMEKLVKQSQDCLKTLQAENERTRQELELASAQQNPDTLEKIRILLSGLDPERQSKAERRIFKFLCECQIKVLNNEEIDDVSMFNAPIY